MTNKILFKGLEVQDGLKDNGWSRCMIGGGNKKVMYYIVHSFRGRKHYIYGPSLYHCTIRKLKDNTTEETIDYTEWIINDLTHRLERPAWITCETKDWFYMDWPHRSDGPAHEGYMAKDIDGEEIWTGNAWSLYGISLQDYYAML